MANEEQRSKSRLIEQAYRERNREAIRARKLELYHANRDKRKEQAAAYRERNKVRLAGERANRRLADPEYAAASRRRNNECRLRHLEKNRARHAAKYRNGTPEYKLKHNSLSSLRRSLKGLGGKRWHEAVGYSREELKSHLERQFTKGMDWTNYGSHWHVDHIVPVSAFECSSVDTPEFKACWALANLRPLWAFDNISKNSKRLHLI